MAEITLHIGLNKTGTSSIQDMLSMNPGPLGALGIVYPEHGRMGTAHHNVAKWLKKMPGDADPRQDELGKALCAELANTPRAILSSEEFHTLTSRGVKLLSKLLSGHDVKVYLYVRDHLRYMASWYQQSIQSTHLSLSFDKFCDYAHAPFMAVADRWAASFGQDNVVLRLYDRAALRNKDVVSDLLYEALGIDDLKGFERKPRDSNPSLSGNLLFFKRIINNFLPKAEAGGQLANECTALASLDPTFSGSILVDDAVAKFVNNLYAGDRAKLDKKYGIVFPPTKSSGVPVPDLGRLTDDWKLITQHARLKDFKVAQYFDLIESFDPSMLAAASATAIKPATGGDDGDRLARLEQEFKAMRSRQDDLETRLTKLAGP
ncbi:MAG: sulfotransferase domain-containing protein [Proteobacteria bacterium]|nr:sulfotransferase domain-containing protein [Pseudomonadota bacterium]